MQFFSDNLTRMISCIALGNPILPGAAVVRSLPHENGSSKCIWVIPPHHQTCSLKPSSTPCRTKETRKPFWWNELKVKKRGSRRAEWQLRPCSSFEERPVKGAKPEIMKSQVAVAVKGRRAIERLRKFEKAIKYIVILLSRAEKFYWGSYPSTLGKHPPPWQTLPPPPGSRCSPVSTLLLRDTESTGPTHWRRIPVLEPGTEQKITKHACTLGGSLLLEWPKSWLPLHTERLIPQMPKLWATHKPFLIPGEYLLPVTLWWPVSHPSLSWQQVCLQRQRKIRILSFLHPAGSLLTALPPSYQFLHYFWLG